MVWRAEKRSLRAASCCNVDVVNGAAGRRVYGFVSRFDTANSVLGRRSASASASALVSSSATTSPFELSEVVVVTAAGDALAVEAGQLRFE